MASGIVTLIFLAICGLCTFATNATNIVSAIGIGPAGIMVARPGTYSTPSDVAHLIEHGHDEHSGVIGFGFPMGMSVSNLNEGKCYFSSLPGEMFGVIDVRFWRCW